MNVASIDLGTNTCLLLVAKKDPKNGEIQEVIGDFATVVRLGEGVDQNHQLGEGAMDRTLACLRQYVQKIQEFGIDPAQVVCVATSQARDAKNGSAFFERVSEELHLYFKTLSGQDEARLSFLGSLLPEMDRDRVAVMDIGGGSTEFMAKLGGLSVDVGSVRFTERYFSAAVDPNVDRPVTDQEFWDCQKAIDLELEKLKGWREVQGPDSQLVAVAGTATTLASWFLDLPEFDPSAIHQLTLTSGDLHRLVEELKWRTVKERAELTGIEKGRADVILAGALIFWRAMEVLDFPKVRVSTRGLRYGVLLN